MSLPTRFVTEGNRMVVVVVCLCVGASHKRCRLEKGWKCWISSFNAVGRFFIEKIEIERGCNVVAFMAPTQKENRCLYELYKQFQIIAKAASTTDTQLTYIGTLITKS